MTQANFKRGKLTISQCFIKYKIFLKLMFHSNAILLHWRNGSRKICDDIRLQSKAKYGQITQNCQRQFYVGSFCLLNVLSRRGGGDRGGIMLLFSISFSVKSPTTFCQSRLISTVISQRYALRSLFLSNFTFVLQLPQNLQPISVIRSRVGAAQFRSRHARLPSRSRPLLPLVCLFEISE